MFRYLNQQHIKTQKLSEADITYGAYTPDPAEQLEIGELGMEIWKEHMIEPLREELIKLLLEVIEDDRRGKTSVNPSDVAKVIIQSFVQVQKDNKNPGAEVYRVSVTMFLESFKA